MFPIPHGIGVVLGNQPASRICYINYLRRKYQLETITIKTEVGPWKKKPRPSSIEDLVR